MTDKDAIRKLVLFDVDGTLMRGNKAHMKTFRNAFKEVLNIDLAETEPSNCHGYTDTGIVYELMKRNNIEIKEETKQKIFNAMIKEFKTADLSGSVLIDGVKETLTELSKHHNIIIGLVTGNLESIAYTKLKHLNVREYFVLGGFGHVSDVRSELIIDAIKQSEEKYGPISKDNIFIIGDTRRDITAAKEAGVKVLAVATGNVPIEELKKENPNYIFENLKDTDKVLQVIQHG